MFDPRRCVDYVFYYPTQRVPNSGSCGLAACDGYIEGSALGADHDFNRTFGIVDTCTTNMAEEEEEVSKPW